MPCWPCCSEGPKYGLQLRQEFEARTGEVWPLNVGQVYTTLGRLERDGLVGLGRSRGRRRSPEALPHHERRATQELTRWLTTPPETTSPPRDELVIKVLVASGVPGVDVQDVIQAHRRHLVELMQQWTRLKKDEAEHDVNLALVVDCGALPARRRRSAGSTRPAPAWAGRAHPRPPRCRLRAP